MYPLLVSGANRIPPHESDERREGIAISVLADRLRRLEAFGIIGRARDDSDRRRFVYRLTRKGIDLAPVLVELVLWSARHEDTAAPAATVRRIRSAPGAPCSRSTAARVDII